MSDPFNPYEVLGVNHKSTDEEVRAAYIVLAKKHHPDKKKGDTVKFTEVVHAYTQIRTKSARREWDKYIEVFYGGKKCENCRGEGATSKTKGLTVKEYTTCKSCKGAGLIPKSKEKKDVTIELHGTAGTSSKGRNNKRRS